MRDRIRSAARAAGISVALGIAAGLNVGAASPSAQQPADPTSALLAEVHALRLAMEQQASIGPRMQLTLARLTIEEQRVTHLAGEVNTIRQQLSASEVDTQRSSDGLADLDRAIQNETDLARRRELETMQRAEQRALRQHAAQVQQLRTRENETAQALAAEQTRWTDLNTRLDELERLLAPVR